jgi:hypothetical protein
VWVFLCAFCVPKRATKVPVVCVLCPCQTHQKYTIARTPNQPNELAQTHSTNTHARFGEHCVPEHDRYAHLTRCCCGAYVCTKSTPYTCCREVHETLLIYLGLMIGLLAVGAGFGAMPRSWWIRVRRSILFATGGAVDIRPYISGEQQPSELDRSMRRRRIVGGNDTTNRNSNKASLSQMASDYHTSWLDQHGLNKQGRDE